MTNEPTTYHLLVTLPDTYGEQADQIVDILEGILRDGHKFWEVDVPADATVTHLTPETLPDRYIERAEVVEWLRRAPNGVSLPSVGDLLQQRKDRGIL